MSRLIAPASAAPMRARRHQRGMGTLTLSSLLLFILTIVVFYLNRSALFEQKTANNQMQAQQALAVAEAGIEWATGMLNVPLDLNAACQPLTTAVEGFRKMYVITNWDRVGSPNTDVAVATNLFPGCKVTAAGLACNCPTNVLGGSANLGTNLAPSFTVSFANVPDDPESVRIVSRGCTAMAAACDAANAATADAQATVSVVLKLRPTLRSTPSTPLTCGTNCDIGGSANILNKDVGTNGILVNAGSNINASGGTNLSTLPGQPPQNALVSNDASLKDLASSDPTCDNSTMFNAYFGSTIEQYAALPSTKNMSCSSAADCKTKLQTAYDEGWRSFYFTSDLQLSGNGTFGSVTEPVVFVTKNAISATGGWDIYGVIFSNSSDWSDLGTGSARIHGAQVTCGEYRNTGNGTLEYDAETLKNARRITGLVVRVPGSWRDF